MKLKRVLPVILTMIFLSTAFAAQRSIPEDPDTHSLKLTFNSETIRGDYLLIDARTPGQKTRNLREGKLDGSVIVFFHGHAQRPGDGYNFSSQLALKSRSGVVIIPVCDTPFGENPAWRGDNGKDVLLMTMVRHILHGMHIEVDGFRPITTSEVLVNGNMEDVPAGKNQRVIPARISAIGWSHGSLLARRFASNYQDSVIDLAQVSPAGYLEWGNSSCTASSCLMASFLWESMRISTESFKGYAGAVFDSGFGVIKGMTGDTARSCSSCLDGNLTLVKLFRNFRDTRDCTLYGDDRNFPVPHLQHLSVVFSANDSLFDPEDILGRSKRPKPDKSTTDSFWQTFYPGAAANGTRLHLDILPGKHIGPVCYPEKYASSVLHHISQLKE